jgi:hypothetical protein
MNCCWNCLKVPQNTNTKSVEEIVFGEHAQEVKRIWNGEPPTKLVESWERRGIDITKHKQYYNAGTMKARYCRICLLGYGNTSVGYCCKCRGLNTHLVKYQLDGAVIVERYCSEHLPGDING